VVDGDGRHDGDSTVMDGNGRRNRDLKAMDGLMAMMDSPWCEDDTCMLGWGIVMHQVMVWAKATDHHGCFRHKISVSAETRVNFMSQKVS